MSLLALQRDFRSWLTTESADAAVRLDGGEEAGLAVYLNTYRAQLMACLADSFEKTRAWLGDAAFEAAAAMHIDRLAPHSWTLDDYVLDFPETLGLLYPDDPEVAELAGLERALGLAFIGIDAEPIDPATLTAIDWDRAVLGLVPTLSFFPALTNAGEIWSAIAAGDRPPAARLLLQPARCAVWRSGFIPAFRIVEADEMTALALASDGRDFATICAHLMERRGEEHGLALAGALLGQWLQDGMIRDITTGGEA